MPANGISAVHPIPDPVVLVVLKCTLILGLLVTRPLHYESKYMWKPHRDV